MLSHQLYQRKGKKGIEEGTKASGEVKRDSMKGGGEGTVLLCCWGEGRGE